MTNAIEFETFIAERADELVTNLAQALDIEDTEFFCSFDPEDYVGDPGYIGSYNISVKHTPMEAILDARGTMEWLVANGIERLEA